MISSACRGKIPYRVCTRYHVTYSVPAMLYRYALQLAIKCKKYYKTLFLGFVHLAIVNAFIVFNYRRVQDGSAKLSHIKFLKQLHLKLCQLREADSEVCASGGAFNRRPPRPRGTRQGSLPTFSSVMTSGARPVTSKGASGTRGLSRSAHCSSAPTTRGAATLPSTAARAS